MAEKVRLFDLSNQQPVIQLIAAVSIVILAGTLLFYLFLFTGSLIFGTDVSEMLSITSEGVVLREESILKYLQASQQIALFVIPAIIIAALLRREKESFLKTDRLPDSIPIIMVILLALLIIPVASYTGILNSKMDLPEWLSGVEIWMRAKENIASDLTGMLIKSTGIGDLMINILIMAAIPSIAEEMIFRGVLQQILCRMFKSGHIGIWITAILFSAVHLQFFGFVPRLILGLGFGYLFFWSGNLWLPIIAHFINNAIPVVIAHFIEWKDLSEKASGLVEKQILLPLIPAISVVGIFYYFWSVQKKNFVKNA
jgi:membrane protease YdiL (CAAX protease family)